MSLVASLSAVTELAAPSACAACGRPGAAVCPACRAALDLTWFPGGPRVVRRLPGPGGPVPCLASGPYDGVARALLHAFKDGDRRDVAPLLAVGLLAALLRVATGTDAEIVTVPAPSGRRAERRRGDRPVVTLARAAARASPLPVRVASLLRTERAVADQSTLGRRDRARNVDGAFAVTRTSLVRSRPALRATEGSSGLVLVDDVLTTGATAGECLRALAAAGLPVRAVVTALVTGR